MFDFRGAAQNRELLAHLGVTHVLNTAEGKRSGTVDTSQVNQNFVLESFFYNNNIL